MPAKMSSSMSAPEFRSHTANSSESAASSVGASAGLGAFLEIPAADLSQGKKAVGKHSGAGKRSGVAKQNSDESGSDSDEKKNRKPRKSIAASKTGMKKKQDSDESDSDSDEKNRKPRKSIAASKKGTKKKAKSGDSEEPQGLDGSLEKVRESAWEFRLHQSRRWGRTLQCSDGSNNAAVKKLTKTLADRRTASEGALRRTAIEALIPAAAVGNRSALTAQGKGFADTRSDAVRRCALDSLKIAAGNKRAEKGGAVAVALHGALPPDNSKFFVEVRRTAVEALAQLAPKGDSRSTKLATEWLNDEDFMVRRRATEALGTIGTSESHVASVANKFEDKDWRVSRAAVQALEQLAATARLSDGEFALGETLGSTVGSTMGGSTMDLGSTVGSTTRRPSTTTERSASSPPSTSQSRRMSVSGSRRGGKSAKHSSKGGVEGKVVEALAAGCSGGSLYGLTRVEALEALGRVAEPGDAVAMDAAASRLEDVDLQVRRHATELLAAFSEGHARQGLDLAGAKVKHEGDYRIRGAASKVLLTVSEPSGETQKAIDLTAKGLDQKGWGGRRGVGVTLRELSILDGGKARAATLACLLQRLEDDDWSVRRKAVQAVGEIMSASEGDIFAVRMLAVILADPDEEVRLVVARALPAAAPLKCKEAIALEGRLCADDSQEVRLAAIEAVTDLASEHRSRSREAVWLLARALEHQDSETRSAAARALHTIASGRRTAIDAAAARLRRGEEHVRMAGVDAFRGVAPANRERGMIWATHLLRFSDPGVRAAAAAAMTQMSDPVHEFGIAAAARIMAKFKRLETVDEDSSSDDDVPSIARGQGSVAGSGSEGSVSQQPRNQRSSLALPKGNSRGGKGSSRAPSDAGSSMSLALPKGKARGGKGSSQAPSVAGSTTSRVSSRSGSRTVSESGDVLSALMRGDVGAATDVARGVATKQSQKEWLKSLDAEPEMSESGTDEDDCGECQTTLGSIFSDEKVKMIYEWIDKYLPKASSDDDGEGGSGDEDGSQGDIRTRRKKIQQKIDLGEGFGGGGFGRDLRVDADKRPEGGRNQGYAPQVRRPSIAGSDGD